MTSSSISVPYPWQRPVWQRLCQQLEADQLPHALLFTGLQGVGKTQLVASFAQLLLCNQPEHSLACGHCKGCNLFNAHTHPDFQQVGPEEGKQIKIEDIRSVQNRVHGAAQLSGRKVVLIGPAEALNLSAANALLKTLEEPPGATHLLLYSHQPSGVLPTINSRCQAVKLPIPEQQTALNWLTKIAGERAVELLQAARGLPVKAMDMLEGDHLAARDKVRDCLARLANGDAGPVAMAQALKGYPLDQSCLHVIDCVESWLQASVTTEASRGGWQEQAAAMLLFRDKAVALLAKARGGANPNAQLALEDLLIDFARIKVVL